MFIRSEISPVFATFFPSIADGTKNKLCWLRSWVQIIPPGPLFNVVQLRYYFKLIFDECRTDRFGSNANAVCSTLSDIMKIKREVGCLNE